MKLTAYDAWIFARIVADLPVNGELQGVSGPLKPLASYLRGLPRIDRPRALQAGCAALGDDGEALHRGAFDADPEALPAEAGTAERPASLADLRRVMSGSQWVWPGWIAAARVAGITASEGVGKTRLAMDLARRIWFALPWPDDQPPTFPERTPTLWVCSDGQQDDLIEIAEACGLPDDAIFFNAPPEEPYGGTDLDDAESLPRLERFIVQVRPGLVFIDSLTFATERDVCQARDVKLLMTPIRDIAQRTQTAIVPLLHVSMDGQALGKRIKGITRTILRLECPDPEQSARLRLSVSKSFAKKPPALGVVMGDSGNEYDPDPPTAPEPGKPGRPPKERDKAERFIREALSRENDRIGNELRAEWEKSGGCDKTFWRAVDGMDDVTKDGGPGTGRQVVLHLNTAHTDPGTEP